MSFACTRPARSTRASSATTLTRCASRSFPCSKSDRMGGKDAIEAKRRAMRTKTVAVGAMTCLPCATSCASCVSRWLP
eukprot:6186535-Pleurochrysis_carterae.AAC.1